MELMEDIKAAAAGGAEGSVAVAKAEVPGKAAAVAASSAKPTANQEVALKLM